MCQLNLYIIPKTAKKDLVLQLMKDYFDYQNPECITEENLLSEIKDEYNVFISAGMGCNCGTVQAYFQDEDDSKSWIELKENLIYEQREKLEKVRQLLERKDYLEYKQEILNKQTELIKKREAAKGQEAEDALKKLQNFISDNQLLFETIMKYEKRKVENGKEIVYHEIDEEIKSAERYAIGNVESEFENLKNFVNDILKETEEIKLFSYWQDESKPLIEDEDYVMQNELKIENIVYLKYNVLLTIFK